MGKIIKKRIEYGGSSNSAENIKYDDTKNVKEAINEVDNLLGNTDISAIGDGTVTGGLNALNSNLQKIGTDEFTDYVFDTTKYKLLVITFFETSIVNSYVTVVIPSIIGLQQASIVICGPSAGENYVYNVVVKFQVKADGIGWAFAKFDLCSSPTVTRDLIIDRLESIVGIKK